MLIYTNNAEYGVTSSQILCPFQGFREAFFVCLVALSSNRDARHILKFLLRHSVVVCSVCASS